MPRVTIREAAQRQGVSVDTIRRQIRRGELGATREQHGRGSVLYVDLPDDLPMGTPTAAAEATLGTGTLDNVQGSETDILRDYVAELKRQLGVREREVEQLHTLLAQVQHALPQPRVEPEAQPYADPAQPTAPERETPGHGWAQRLRQRLGL